MTQRSFIHALDLRNFFACHNISLDGSLWTPNFLDLADEGLRATHRHIGEIPIEELRSTGPTGNVLAPRVAAYFIPGAIWGAGQKLANGYGQEIQISEGKKANMIDVRDAELAFEASRRRYSPNSTSRVSCIWLAEHSAEGEAVVRHMFGNNSHIVIVGMRITHQLSLSRADARWFEEYCYSPSESKVENYWKEVPHPDGPRWEWLLDGRVELSNADDLELIRAKRATSPTQ
ncbi:hypothetical protein ACSFBX_22430 [Variovorax sp. RB2P76]|jgi:hypothetical protein|uniref:hypothetical protein n=1 Tax=Variovorax sp. RB2P76 TaxID=3443736 RepID=UPI003F464FE7